MVLRNLLITALVGISAFTPAADARPHRDREQDAALRGRIEGRIMSLRSIESMVVPQYPEKKGFDYLGPELDASSGRYRLKFMRGGQVFWIDVDARTGQVIGQSGR
jgi:uncharacterized membrane protein YkoI